MGGGNSFVACFSRVTIDHTLMETPSRFRCPLRFFFLPYITRKLLTYLISALVRRLWPPFTP